MSAFVFTKVKISLAAFLASVNSDASLLLFGPVNTQPLREVYFTASRPRAAYAVDHHRARPILLCHCFVKQV